MVNVRSILIRWLAVALVIPTLLAGQALSLGQVRHCAGHPECARIAEKPHVHLSGRMHCGHDHGQETAKNRELLPVSEQASPEGLAAKKPSERNHDRDAVYFDASSLAGIVRSSQVSAKTVPLGSTDLLGTAAVSLGLLNGGLPPDLQTVGKSPPGLDSHCPLFLRVCSLRI